MIMIPMRTELGGAWWQGHWWVRVEPSQNFSSKAADHSQSSAFVQGTDEWRETTAEKRIKMYIRPEVRHTDESESEHDEGAKERRSEDLDRVNTGRARHRN